MAELAEVGDGIFYNILIYRGDELGEKGRRLWWDLREERVMEMRRTVLGEEHPDTLGSMNNLALTWKNQGRTRDALALMHSCVILRERVLDTDHPDTEASAAILAEWENMSDCLDETYE
ncbi:hypothetical protein ACKRZS_002162 [Fusarium odoratissimum]